MPDEFLTLPQVAELLQVGAKTIYAMAAKGELPGFKVSSQWRFKRADLDQWVDQQKQNAQPQKPRPKALAKKPSAKNTSARVKKAPAKKAQRK